MFALCVGLVSELELILSMMLLLLCGNVSSLAPQY